MALSMDWNAESYPTSKDFVAVPLFSSFFFALRFFLDSFVFEPLARRLLFGKDSGKLDLATKEGRKKIAKFKESAWKFVYFLSAELLAVYVSYDEPWLTSTKYFWVGPGNQTWPDQKIKLKLKFLYLYSAGFYVYSIFALVFWETRRSDFWISMAHHVISFALLFFSHIFRFVRVGSIILPIHDATDSFLEMAKMSRYSGYDGLGSLFFLSFVIAWTILRMGYFPFWILYSTSYEVVLYFDKEKHAAEGPLYYYVFNTLLYMLFVFNFYWWLLMLRMVKAQIQARGQLSDDVRSDSEGEDDHTD
ncbi:hypothetical protein MLD38_032809 [Melastoma candidum]|uniref:Uncharacterized protein n=1 Tax=Melastoma candidum TaxID=119954 RepID=A0ACB9M4Q8_9MYRT|nr:hypothetical protein MLD38_032809 [Melastoma candidum]